MITISTARAALQKLNNDEDVQIQQWVNAITANVEQYCNQPITAKTKVIERYYERPVVFGYPPVDLADAASFGLLNDESATGARLLIPLPFVAVPVSLTEAEYRSSVFDAYVSDVSNVTLVTVNDAPHVARRAGFANYYWRLTFTAGYSTTTTNNLTTASSVPADLQHVAIEMLQIMQKNDPSGKAALGVNTITTSSQGASVSIALKDMRPEWREVLDNYKVQSIR